MVQQPVSTEQVETRILSKILLLLSNLLEEQVKQRKVLNDVLKQGAKLMVVAKDILDLCTRLDTASNAIAARIQKLIDQLSQGAISAEDAQAIADKLTLEVTALEALGADPSNPVPTLK